LVFRESTLSDEGFVLPSVRRGAFFVVQYTIIFYLKDNFSSKLLYFAIPINHTTYKMGISMELEFDLSGTCLIWRRTP
jgi:hypothetical protein